jgi:hypothetical protein
MGAAVGSEDVEDGVGGASGLAITVEDRVLLEGLLNGNGGQDIVVAFI